MTKVYLARQDIRHHVVPDPASASTAELQKLEGRVTAGDRVAVACGSRGINSIEHIAKAVIAQLKRLGAEPFVFPAMGCHGGGTRNGQRATLEHLGLTEAWLDCPVLSEIEPREIGVTAEGVPVYMDVNAWEADHVLVINRVKPHSDFFGMIGSGLVKILVIGCGKMKAAEVTHDAATTYGLERMLRSVASVVLSRKSVLGGLGVIEGPTGKIARITWVPGNDLLDTEPEQFAEACRLAPVIPVPTASLLVIDWMGKDISGCGIDPFVIGRQEYLNVHNSYTDFHADRIYVRDLTDASLGNADGVGMADATTERLISKLDYDAIRIGVLTSRTLPLGRVPIFFRSDREALDALLGTASVARKDASLVRIVNTTDLEYLEISENLVDQWEASGKGVLVGEPYELAFDESGNLLPIQRSGGRL